MRYHVNMKNAELSPTSILDTGAHPLTLLGGISAQQFLHEYWQKRPLLIRAAIPDFHGVLSPEELAGLACEEDVQSRLVSQHAGAWQLEHGPLDEARFADLPEKDWTLLVQAVNHHVPQAAQLLQQFSFIPHARLDDLMVSYAPDGGGVGPHFDSYDVFLLQGQGQRLWRISAQQDLSLVEDAPLRILRQFTAEQEWLLQPGDMLYLPPHLAHWGIAVGDCMTYSIGFRAPSQQELTGEFLSFLQEQGVPARMYQDADLAWQARPALISGDMVSKVADMLANIRWTQEDVSQFLGRYLSEPGHDVVFEPPRALGLAAFCKRAAKQGLALALKSRMLFTQSALYLNGEVVAAEFAGCDGLMQLADTRSLAAAQFANLGQAVMQLLHDWYLAGYVEIGTMSG